MKVLRAVIHEHLLSTIVWVTFGVLGNAIAFGLLFLASSAEAVEPMTISSTVYEGRVKDYDVKIVETPADTNNTTTYTTVILCPLAQSVQCLLGTAVPGRVKGSRLIAGDKRWYPVTVYAERGPGKRRRKELLELLNTAYDAVHKPEFVTMRSNIGHAP